MAHDAPARRLSWIDLLRGLAVVGMVETHVLNVFLDARFDSAPWRGEVSFFNGLVAPAFLWIAGYIQGLSIRRSHARGGRVASGARWHRLGVVAGIGFLLHVPWHLWGQGNFGLESWRYLLQVDVLPCLALSLGILLAVGCLGARWFDLVTLALGLGFVVLAPVAATWHPGIPLLEGLLNREEGSLFPLFPWLGFCAAGSLASRWRMENLVWLGLGGLLAWMGDALAMGPFSSLQPWFFVERLGWLLILVWGVNRVSLFFAPAWVQLAGRESLLVYVLHLVLLHSLPAGGGLTLDRRIGQTLSVGETLAVFAGLLTLCLLAAWFNEWRKARAKERENVPPEAVSA